MYCTTLLFLNTTDHEQDGKGQCQKKKKNYIYEQKEFGRYLDAKTTTL